MLGSRLERKGNKVRDLTSCHISEGQGEVNQHRRGLQTFCAHEVNGAESVFSSFSSHCNVFLISQLNYLSLH